MKCFLIVLVAWAGLASGGDGSQKNDTHGRPNHVSPKPPEVSSEPTPTADTPTPSTFSTLSLAKFQKRLGDEKIEVVLFTKKTAKSTKKILSKFQKIRAILSQFSIPFVHVPLSRMQANTTKVDYQRLPSVYLYVDALGRHFGGELKVPDVSLWLKEAILADIFAITDMSQVLKMDRHYFAYARSSWHTHNGPQLESLAKLLYPIGLYTGMTPKLERQTFPGLPKKAKLWVFRKFDGKVIPIDTTQDVEDMLTQILAGEHLKSLHCDDQAYHLLRDVKLPVLVYFAGANDTLATWQLVQDAAEGFHEYLTPILVEHEATNRCAEFLNSFLEVEKKPSLRILNTHGRIRRHLFVGAFEPKQIRFFLSNYVHGNLKSFKINESIPDGTPGDPAVPDLTPLNSKTLNTLLKGSNFENLVYIYEPGHPLLDAHLGHLRAMQTEVQSWAQRVRFFIFNAHKNDIGSKMIERTPFLILVKRDGKTERYRGRIDVEKVREFLLKELIETADAPVIEGL